MTARLVALACGVAMAMLALAEPLPVRALRDLLFDGYQRLAPRNFDPAMPVRIIDIDDESLRRLGQWPWPRSLLARLIATTGAGGPAALGLDIVLSEADRLSPERLAEIMPALPERDALIARLSGLPSHDHVLAEALAPLPSVAGLALGEGAGMPPQRGGVAVAGDDPARFVPRFAGALTPIPVLEAAFKGFGALNWVPDRDQVVRRVPAVLAAGDRLVASLAIEMLRVAQGASTLQVKASSASGETAFGRPSGVVAVKVGAVVVPTAADGSLRPSFAGSRPERRIPAWKLLAGDIAADALAGRFVLVGASATALSDMRATPLDAAVPGVEIHAETLESLLAGRHLVRPDWARGAEAVGAVAAAGLAVVLAAGLAPLAASGMLLVLIGGLMFGSWQLFSGGALLLDPLVAALAALLAFAIVGIARWKASDNERRAVRAAFQHYLSPAMVEQLAHAPDRLRLGGEERDLTVLFSDVRGFSRLAEAHRQDPQALTALMNRLLTPLSQAILDRSGTIDKYVGDAIMAFWNAPLDVEDHAARAAEAALDMQRRLAALNAALAAEAAGEGRAFAPLIVGIGINTGLCVVGNMGSDARFDYSALGDPVNLAARLESQTRIYEVPILVGGDTASRLAERFALVELDLIRVRGKDRPERIHALLGGAAERQQDGFAALEGAVAALRTAYRAGQWDGADAALARVAPLAEPFGLGGFVTVMRRRIARLRLAPIENWTGISEADER